MYFNLLVAFVSVLDILTKKSKFHCRCMVDEPSGKTQQIGC